MSRQDDTPLHIPDTPLTFAVAERDRHVLQMVRDAIASRNVLLAFQPVIQTARPNKTAFYEGLIRVLDGTGRVIPARDFIDVIETSETGRQIDCLALEMSLRTLLDHAQLRISINMSARSIGYPRWREILNHGISADPTVAERLILEITEASAMVMPDLVQVFMSDLQHKGICFALDDFGAGYTSFRYLRDFYFDIIKIDGQFIRDIHRNPDNQVLTEALISIAQHFEMFTVAEYVENARDAKFLAQAGIDCMQGFYFGMPTTRPYWAAREVRRAG